MDEMDVLYFEESKLRCAASLWSKLCITSVKYRVKSVPTCEYLYVCRL